MSVDTGEALRADTDNIARMKALAERKQPDAMFHTELVRKTLDKLTDGGTKDLETASDDDKKEIRDAFRRIAEESVGVEPEVVSCLYEPETLDDDSELATPRGFGGLRVEAVETFTTRLERFANSEFGRKFMESGALERAGMITEVPVHELEAKPQ